MREHLLQRDHLAVGLLTWDTQDKRKAIENISRDTSLPSKCTAGTTKFLANWWARTDGPSPVGGAAKYLHIWVLSSLLRHSLREAFTALAVTKWCPPHGLDSVLKGWLEHF